MSNSGTQVKAIRRPFDITYPEHTPLQNGALFVVLPTLHEQEEFWRSHGAQLPYAVEEGWTCDTYLGDDGWLFAPTKASLVKAVLRWDALGIGVAYVPAGVDEFGRPYAAGWTLTNLLPSMDLDELLSPDAAIPDDPSMTPDEVASVFQDLVFAGGLDGLSPLWFHDAAAFEAQLARRKEERWDDQ